mgnify:CR=1 FL=1
MLCPVPPFAATKVPAKVTTPLVAVAGVNPVVPPEIVVTPSLEGEVHVKVPLPVVLKTCPLDPCAIG